MKIAMRWSVVAVATMLAWAPPALSQSAREPSRGELIEVLAALALAEDGALVQAVARAGATHHPLMIDPLRALLVDGGPEVRVAAAEALGELGIPPASGDLAAMVTSLLTAARHPDEALAIAAVRAVARYPFPDVRTRLGAVAAISSTPESVRRAIRAGLASPDVAESRARIEAWVEMARAEALSIGEGVTADMTVTAPGARWRVPPDDVLRHARDLLDPKGAPQRPAVVASLGASPEAVPFLLRALREPEPAARVAAVLSLAQLSEPGVDAALSSVVRDPDVAVRTQVAAAWAARIETRPEQVPLLLAWLDRESIRGVHTAIVQALVHAPREVLVEALASVPRPSSDGAIRDGLAMLAPLESLPAPLLLRWMIDAEDEVIAERLAAAATAVPEELLVSTMVDELTRLSTDETRRARVRALLGLRRDPRVSASLIQTIAQGHATNGDLALLAAQPEAEIRAPVLALVAAPDNGARAKALEVARGWSGPDVVEALGAALATAPDDDHAFAALLRQPDPLRIEPLTQMLLAPEHVSRRRAILRSLESVEDERVARAAARLAEIEPTVAAQVIELLERQREANAVPALARMTADTRVAVPVRVRAIELVARRAEHGLAVEHLLAVARDPELDVKMAARTELHALDPSVFPEWDPYGRIPLVAVGAGFGASMLLLAHDIAEARLSPAFTGGAGLVLGAATPYLLTRGEEVTLGDASYFASTALWGTLGGWGLGAALGAEGRDTRWLTLAGQGVGLAAGALTLSATEWSLGDAVLANTTALEAAITAATLQSLLGDDERQAAFMIAGAVTMVPMTILARRLEVRDDLGLVVTAMAHGAWLGALAPAAFGRDGEALRGIVIGQGVGYLAGLALAHATDGDLALNLGSFAGSALGAATLGGLALSIDGSNSQLRAALTGAGSIGGLLAVGLLADRLELHGNDVWLITLGGALGAFGGARLEVRRAENDFEGDRLAGNILLGTGAGVLGGLLLSQLVDATDAELSRSLGGGGLLALAGFGLGQAFDDLSPSTRSALSGAGFLAGVALTAPFAERLRLDGATVGFASLSAASFGLWSSQIPAWTPGALTAEHGLASAAVGGSLGFSGGLALAQLLPVETADLPFIASGALVGSLAGVGAGLSFPELGAGPRAGLAQGLGLAGFVGASALALTQDRGAFRNDVTAPAALLGAHGALLGGLLVPARLAHAATAEEVGGGVLLGASLGATAGVLAAELGGYALPGDVIAESSLFSAAAYAIGGGAGLIADDLQLGSGLMEGLGAAALLGSLIAAPHTRYDPNDVQLAGILAIMGGWHGGWLGSIGGSNAAAGGALMGGGLALMSGMVLSPWLDVSPHDTVQLLLITEAATAIGGGLTWSLDGVSARDSAIVLSLAGAGGFAAASVLASHTEVSPADAGLIGLTTAAGAWYGARAAPLWTGADEQRRVASAVAGAGAGYLGGLMLSQLVELEPLDVVEAGMIGAAGGAIAGGLELSLDALSPAESAALSTAVGLGAYATGLALASFTEYGGDDPYLVATTTALGAWHGMLLAPLVSDDNARATGGFVLAGAGVGTLAGLALAQAHELEPGDDAELALLTAAGDAVGAGVSWMLDDPNAGVTGALASAVGLGTFAGALLAVPHTHYTPSDYGLIALGTSLGVWHGTWASALLGENARGSRTGGGAMLGFGAGVLVSSVVAGFTDVSAASMGEAVAMWGYGSAIGGGLALTTGSGSRTRSAAFVEAGGLAGLAGAAAFSEHTSFTVEDGLLVGVLGLAGAWHGSTLPLLGGGSSAEARGGGALLGAGAFALGGHLLAQTLDYQKTDIAEIAVGTMLGNAMGFGLGLVVPGADERARIALVDGLGLGAMATMLLLAPSIDVDDQVWANAALFSTMGAALGATLPGTWSGPTLGDTAAESVGGGALLGATLGLGASALLADALPMSGERRETIALGAMAGGLTGAGLGMALSEDDRWAAGLFEGLTLVGAAAVGATLDRVDLTLGDAALGTTWTAYLTWHQLGVTLLTGGTPREAAGATMASVGIGTLTGAYLVPRLHLEGEQVLMLFAGSVWGSWIGGWSGAMLERSTSYEGGQSAGLLLLASVLGSDVGMGLTSLVLTDLLHVEPTRFAVINLAGLGGMMVGMLTAGFAQEEPLMAGNVIGSLAGLTLGAIVTSFFDFSEQVSPYEEVAERRAAEGTAPGVFSVKEWFPTARVEPTPSGDGERYMIGVVGRWD